jgi:hypothetical protein
MNIKLMGPGRNYGEVYFFWTEIKRSRLRRLNCEVHSGNRKAKSEYVRKKTEPFLCGDFSQSTAWCDNSVLDSVTTKSFETSSLMLTSSGISAEGKHKIRKAMKNNDLFFIVVPLVGRSQELRRHDVITSFHELTWPAAPCQSSDMRWHVA